MANGGAAAAAIAAAIANAIKASGAIVRVEPADFIRILDRSQNPLVVCARGFFGSYQYLTAYKGLAFYTRSPEAIPLPSDAEIVNAGRIWIPG